MKKHGAHIFLGEVYQVLQIDVISVGPNVVVNKKIELVFDPVFKDKGQDSCSQLQEEDDTQEHGELKDRNIHNSLI